MHCGVDFGTTRTIVAVADRGNYPVVAFTDDSGDSHDHIPSVVAATPEGLVFGYAALAAAHEGAPALRSFKRVLADPHVTADTQVAVGDTQVGVLDLLTGFLIEVRESIAQRSSLASAARGPSSAVVAVPAHAHGAQRFLTLEAFKRAGFQVTGMVNEPSAAGFEYTHRQRGTVTSKRTRVIVYDLGGGTFDASLVSVDGISHNVLDSVGLNRLGGDDFDELLAVLAHELAGSPELSDAQWALLVEESQIAKESLTPQSKRVTLEVNGATVVVPVDDFYLAATPLVERTLEAMRPLVGQLDSGEPDLTEVAGVYLVGGGTSLPIVPRLLRERFGRRVHRSPLPSASTAIGLAIAADPEAGYSLTDRLSRGFGVFRERRGGAEMAFDPLLSRDQEVHLDESVSISRRYRAAHNIGWFRFVEFSSLDEHFEPRGELVPFADVVFPFDPGLQDAADLESVVVQRQADGPLIEETYTVDPHGMIEVRITNLDTGFSRTSTLQAARS